MIAEPRSVGGTEMAERVSWGPSADEQRCERSDLPVSMCSHCRNTGTLERTRIADYRTECHNCPRMINPGERIGRVEGRWVCANCAIEAR